MPSRTRLPFTAGKLQNLRAILADHRTVGGALWDRFKGGKEGTLWYYGECLAVFRERDVNAELVDEIARTLAAVEQRADEEGS